MTVGYPEPIAFPSDRVRLPPEGVARAGVAAQRQAKPAKDLREVRLTLPVGFAPRASPFAFQEPCQSEQVLRRDCRFLKEIMMLLQSRAKRLDILLQILCRPHKRVLVLDIIKHRHEPLGSDELDADCGNLFNRLAPSGKRTHAHATAPEIFNRSFPSA